MTTQLTETNVSNEPATGDSLPTATSLAAQGDTSLIASLPPEIERQVQDLIKTTKVGESQGIAVLQKFAVGFEPFLRLKDEAERIVVTDASQTDLIARAKEIDKELIEADKMLTDIHKEQKEFYLRPGQMVDGCRRIPSNAIAKVRAHLETQFNFVRNIELARINKIAATRREQLEEYGYTGAVVGLGTITDEQFGVYLAGAKAQFEVNQQSAENARIENERLRAENERLAAENATKKAAEDRRISRVNRLSAIGMTFDGSGYVYQELTFSNSALNDESDDVFAAEFDAVAPVIEQRQAAIQAQARIDKENARIAQEHLDKINADKAEKERKEREAALAPDKEKINAYFKGIHDATQPLPAVTNANAKLLLERFFNDVSNLVNAYAGEAATLDAPDVEVVVVPEGKDGCPF